jgi:UDP-glucose 4-epimerase
MAKEIILVTGGAGFIGSHLIEELVKDSEKEVYSLDNYFIGREDNHIAGATYIKGDTKDIADHIKVIPDKVFHLGEYSRVEQSFADVDQVWKMNVAGTFAVLEFCRLHNCKIIYAGSSTKFADDGLGRDQSPYAWMKATNTELVKNYHQWYNLSYAIVYFYNVYGERELSDGPYATVIGRFKTLLQQNLPITVVSPGTQRRNFTHVKDIVRALVLVGEKGAGDGYGIGNDESISIFELAKLFSDHIEMLPERSGNRLDGKVENVRVKEEFDWQPECSVKDYIKELVDQHKGKTS